MFLCKVGGIMGSAAVLPFETRIEALKRSKIPIIIFGAGIAGETVFHACLDLGIKVAYFTDNNTNKTNAIKANASLCGIDVIDLNTIKNTCPEAQFIIAVADIRDIASQLELMGYSKWHPASFLLHGFDLGKCNYGDRYEFAEFAVGTCLNCHDAFIDSQKIFLRSVDLVITERCSLKCKDCSNLMQYYEKPENADTNECLKSIDEFCALVDSVNEFRIIGGEPFMNKEIHQFIDKLDTEPKVRGVVIYTNGTIVPNERNLQSLKSKKVMVLITDYDALSRNADKLAETFKFHGISFYRQKAMNWTSCATIEKHGRSQEAQEQVF